MGSAARGLVFGAGVAGLVAVAVPFALAQTGTPSATTTKPSTSTSSTTGTTKGATAPAPKKETGTKSAASKDVTAKAATPSKPVATKPATAAKPATPAPRPAPAPSPAKPLPPQQATPLRDTTPSAAPLPGAPVPVVVPGASFRQSQPVLGAFLSGLLGAGLADTLLGTDAPGPGTVAQAPGGNLLEPVAASHSTAETAGQIIRLVLVGALVALAVVAWRRSTAATPARPAVMRRRSAPALSGLDSVGPADDGPALDTRAHPDALKAIADEQDFADILLVVQAGWSEGNVMAMRSHITPDIATWFDRRLAQNVDNGVENRVVDVSNIRVERLEDWEEAGLHFARARMRWRAIDYVIDMAKLPDEPGYIIDGSPEEPVECEEVWTFVKSPDGAWVLCEVDNGR